MFCSFSSEFRFIGDKISADYFKDGITPPLKANDSLKISQYVAINCEREKGKPRCKILYKVSKEEGGYDPLLDIYPFKTLIQLK